MFKYYGELKVVGEPVKEDLEVSTIALNK